MTLRLDDSAPRELAGPRNTHVDIACPRKMFSASCLDLRSLSLNASVPLRLERKVQNCCEYLGRPPRRSLAGTSCTVPSTRATGQRRCASCGTSRPLLGPHRHGQGGRDASGSAVGASGWAASGWADGRAPTYLPIHPPTCHITNLPHQLPTFPPIALLTHLPTYLTYVPIGLPIYPPTCPLPTDTPTHLPSDYLPTNLPTYVT